MTSNIKSTIYIYIYTYIHIQKPEGKRKSTPHVLPSWIDVQRVWRVLTLSLRFIFTFPKVLLSIDDWILPPRFHHNNIHIWWGIKYDYLQNTGWVSSWTVCLSILITHSHANFGSTCIYDTYTYKNISHL